MRTFLLAAALFLPVSGEHTSSITLEWDAVTDSRVEEVRIYYGARTHLYDGFFAVAATRTTAELSGLEPGEMYFIAAATHNEAQGDGQLSKEIRWQAPESPKPFPPIHIDTE